MSKVCRNENEWINIVFEGRNKEYGAYQLRKNEVKTTCKAFLLGLFLVGFFISFGLLLTSFGEKPSPALTSVDAPKLKLITYKNQLKAEAPKKVVSSKKKSKKSTARIPVPFAAAFPLSPEIEEPNTTNFSSDGDENEIESGVVDSGFDSYSLPSTGEDTDIIPTDNATKSTGELDKMPEFPGGIAKFYSYVGSRFEKPELDLNQNIRIEVSFVIETDGSMTSISVSKNPGFGLDKEAIRVLKSLKTKWRPGMIKGKPVRTSYLLPILISLN